MSTTAVLAASGVTNGTARTAWVVLGPTRESDEPSRTLPGGTNRETWAMYLGVGEYGGITTNSSGGALTTHAPVEGLLVQDGWVHREVRNDHGVRPAGDEPLAQLARGVPMVRRPVVVEKYVPVDEPDRPVQQVLQGSSSTQSDWCTW